jgi:hypothetical protein
MFRSRYLFPLAVISGLLLIYAQFSERPEVQAAEPTETGRPSTRARGTESGNTLRQAAGQTEQNENPSFTPLPRAKGLIPLSKDQRIWIDKDKKRVVLDGEVCLTQGSLELFACPWQGKIHESVIKVRAQPATVHAALLAVGGQQGSPVSYQDGYKPARGGVVEILLIWWDADGNRHEAHAQDFVRQRDHPALRNNKRHLQLIELAEKSSDDAIVQNGKELARWAPIPAHVAAYVKRNKQAVTRPSRAGKQIEQLMILTDPSALDPEKEQPKRLYRTQFDPASVANKEHRVLIERANDSPEDVVEVDGRVRARWEPVFPVRAAEVAADRDFVTRPSPEGKQIEQLIVVGGPLEHEWIFAGSQMGQNPETGREFYLADRSGDFICVSNFPTATLDLPIESSADNQNLSFEAMTENIPPKGTPVRMILTPGPMENTQRSADQPAASDAEAEADGSAKTPPPANPAK